MFASLSRFFQNLFSAKRTPPQGEVLPPENKSVSADDGQHLILQDRYTNANGKQTNIEVRGDGIHLQTNGDAEEVISLNGPADALNAIDEDTRYQIARKISLLVPALADSKKQLLLKHVFRALFLLAQDQVPRVRQMIAEELRDSHNAPHELIRKLAWDEEVLVAAPVLEFSPLLSDHDLKEIIAQSDIPGVLEAMSRRKTISGDVTDAIVRNVTQSRLRNEDVRILNTLLENKGATFTETSLETIVDEAPEHEIWHESLIERPELTNRMMNKVARFVSEAMILELKDRGLIEEDLGLNLTKAISARLKNPKIDRGREADKLAVEMFTQGTLDAEAVIAGQEAGEHEFVISAISLLAEFPKNITELIFNSRDPEAITAMCWKAHLPMRVAIAMQLKVAKVPHTNILYAKGGKDFPLTTPQMKKVLEHYVAKAAFSLVELSIVLVILGLLTGGILGGQSLMHAAELRSVGTEVRNYQTAFMTFRDKYFYLPGDLPNATAFWGAADTSGTNGECADGYTNAGTGTQTCNGNGNGTVLWRLAGGFENYRGWQHLQAAGLISGNYTGVTGPNPSIHFTDDLVGENVPQLKYSSGGKVGIAIRDPAFSSAVYTPQDKSHYFLLASCCNGSLRYIEGRGFPPEDAWNLDQKMDDGKVTTGKIQIMKGYWGGCATSNSAATAQYDLQKSESECPITYEAGF